VRATDDMNVLVEMVQEDPSVEPELAAEVDRITEELAEFELKAMMSGKQDSCNALVRIQAGAGGTDACDFAQMLARMYFRWAERRGYKVELIDEVLNEVAGYQSVEFRIVGDYSYGWMQSETGVHRLVRISRFGDGGTRQTSFAAVDILPDFEDNIEIEVKDGDLIMQTFCSGGPGGQHQNKTQSGVRLIHKPTNVRGESRTERSQGKNYDNALNLIKARLFAIEEAKRTGDIASRYDSKGEVSFGSQIRSYVMQPYTLAREERDGIDVKIPAVNSVFDGEIDVFMKAYLKWKTERMHRQAANKA